MMRRGKEYVRKSKEGYEERVFTNIILGDVLYSGKIIV